MSKVRVLYLDTQFQTYIADLEMTGLLEAEVTTLDREDFVVPGGYKESQLGKDFAARATPDTYDLVVIGNNRASGYAYARQLIAEMRDRTLIVWNDYTPGDEEGYVDLGFSHFCSRRDQVGVLLGMLDEQVEFANPEDDTPENRDIVRLVRERVRSDKSTDSSLEEVATELGLELPRLVH